MSFQSEERFLTKVVAADRVGICAAATIIRDGGVVGMPTETVYGLGADALNQKAVEGVFLAKGRPADNPLIVHISDFEMLSTLTQEIPEIANRLMRAFWPGPMTIILKRKSCIPDIVTAGLSTVGIRMPASETARALIRESRRPIAAPSANTSGKPSPTTALHVYRDLRGRIPLILEDGPCRYGVESTVIDVSDGKPVILRPGAVTPEMIESLGNSVEVDQHVLSPLVSGEIARSPGMKYRHYAPEARLVVFAGDEQKVMKKLFSEYDMALQCGEKPVILGFDNREYGVRRVFSLGDKNQPETAAARLFAALRRMDDEKITVGFGEAIPMEGIGIAFMNRIGRAAEFQIVQV